LGGHLSQSEETQFRDQLGKVFLSKLRWGFLAAAVLFGLFAGLDLVLDPGSLRRNGPPRAVALVAYLLLFGLARLPVFRRFGSWLFVVAIALGTAALTWLSLGIVRAGETLAVGSLMLMIALMAAVGPTVRVALVAYGVMLAVTNAVAVALEAAPSFLFAVNAFSLSGTLSGLLMALVTERLARRAFRLQLQLEVLATRDALTGARNRGSFMSVLEEELSRTDRYGGAVSLLLLDIDRFKSINDTHGHPAGDAVIRALAEASLDELRTVDVLGRIGGEEFAVLLPQTELSAALALAERLRAGLERVRVAVGEQALGFTVSIGAAHRRPGEPSDKLISRADRALYEAKNSGRNQVREAA